MINILLFFWMLYADFTVFIVNRFFFFSLGFLVDLIFNNIFGVFENGPNKKVIQSIYKRI